MHGWKGLRFLAVSAACLGALAAAAENSPPDFSDGFERLAKLGLPEMGKDARWVKHANSAQYQHYYLRELTKGMDGSAWAIPSKPQDDKASLLPMGGVDTLESPASQIPKTDADLEKDVDSLITSLREKTDEVESLFRNEMMSGFENPNSGNLLVFAAQIHQAGKTDLANRLAATLFALSSDAEGVVDSAVGTIASSAYRKAIGSFFEKPDFAALHESIADLSQRFPRGWREGQALAMLMPQLAKQAAGGALPEPRIEGVELDSDALATIAAWQKPPQAENAPNHPGMEHYRMGYGGYSPDLWLLGGDDPEQPLQGIHADLLQRGMDALPVLAALAEDPFLTVLPYQNRGGHVYYSSRQSEEELILRAYHQMPRPATRGELACQLLAATLPDPDDQLDEADAASLRSLAMDFWKANKDKGRDDLLLVFMTRGSAQQASQVATRLASSTSPEARAAFEKHVLAADNPLHFIQPVTIYLRTRRAEGKPFYETYAKRVREHAELAGEDIERSWEIRQAGGIDKLLKSLQSLASPESPRSIARNIARGEPDEAEAGIQGLAALIEKQKPAKQLEIYLEGANTTVDPAVRCHFIAATYGIEWPMEEGSNEAQTEEDEPAAPTPPRTISGTEAIIWRKLMADDSEVPETLRGRHDLGSTPTIGRLAASAFEYSISPQELYALRQFAPALGRPTADFLYQRATARIAGDPVPPVPDPARVTDERLREIVAQAAGKPPNEIRAYLDSLTPDERAKWMVWQAEPQDPPMPAEFLKLKNHILARAANSFFNGLSDTPGLLGLEPGFVIDSKSLKARLESQAADLTANSPGIVFINSSATGPGLDIFSHRMDPPPPAENEDEERVTANRQSFLMSIFQNHASTLAEHEDVQGIISVVASGGDQGYSATYWVRDGKLTPSGEDGKTGSWGTEENPEALSDLLDTVLPSADTPRFHLRIECLSREHAASFKSNNE
jgi:hypothetical protein